MRIFLLAVLAAFFGLGGCAIVEDIKKSQAEAREERERAELRKLALAEHAVFREAGGWKKRTYRNKALLSQATIRQRVDGNFPFRTTRYSPGSHRYCHGFSGSNRPQVASHSNR